MKSSLPVSIGRRCVGSAVLLCLLLGGCKTPPLHRGLTQTQVTALKSAGFQETGQGFEFGSSGPILFDFDRYNLKPDVRRIVERIGRTLRSAGINGVRVYGYSDDEGTVAYDRELSRRRAEVVAIELVDVGLDGKRVAVIGKGKSDPVGDNRTPTGRAQNRRAAIVVSPR
ncbi:OmpA family protein [Burkholderia ambifaria]|uniref:OmpA family protein n=1 Tax=Burkholderia ambifaria TaxID=152480 RepID=UPI00158D75E1|nr:OmpA family protein [Burkholderia ambifaria]QQK00937.1 OmpA family protein [Burkholderia ambifaria]